MLKDLRDRMAAEDERDHWKGVAYALACRISDPAMTAEFLEEMVEFASMAATKAQFRDAAGLLRERKGRDEPVQ